MMRIFSFVILRVIAPNVSKIEKFRILKHRNIFRNQDLETRRLFPFDFDSLAMIPMCNLQRKIFLSVHPLYGI